ncbi:MAG: DNA polymerase III subunit gamma/tau [Phycisphaerae bacterium]|nr:DNA polymerase III subunit gamma/tau [Phycisphaerae bacterium]
MSYTVLARRYRSTTFENIVGQDSIAKTLRNAIDSERTAHAYLFSGTRGVGKTSMARIFARELNRSDSLTEEEAIGNAILRGEDLDVIEIDGASNRGVQEARDLIAAAGLAPSRCTYRIYIIDEVHMLTTPAFNALLKTMEEPPSHVKFILCTTEPHKVPSTIQSRCQRFDFRSIPSTKIAEHLSFVLKEEGVKADNSVIAEVARLGNGSMRDSLSILDRLLAGGSKTINANEMEELLGLPSQTAISSLCAAIATNDMQKAFEASDCLIASGISLDRCLEVLSSALRNGLIARVCGEHSPLLELSDESRKEATVLGNQLDEATITHMIALCDATGREVRRGGSGRALFDATIARLCMTGQLSEAGAVLAGNNLTTSTSTKKKRINAITNSQETQKKQTVTIEANKQVASDKVNNSKPEAQVSPPVTTTEISDEQALKAIEETPGLKRIAKYLKIVQLERNSISFGINNEGRESTKYIFAQEQKIAEVLSGLANRKMTVSISVPESEKPLSRSAVSLEVVEDNELVKVARGLFDGTVVQVTNVKGNS